MPHTRTPLALVGLVAALVLGGAAPAAAQAPKIERQVFDVSVEITHTVDWTYNTTLERLNCSSWTRADGDQELIITPKRPTRLEITWVTWPNKKEPDVTHSLLSTGRERYVVRSNGNFVRNEAMRRECVPCGPTGEYGECPDKMPVNKSGSIACPTHRGRAVSDLRYIHEVADQPDFDDDLLAELGHVLLVETRWTAPKALSRCLPIKIGQYLELAQPLPEMVNVTSLARRMWDRGKEKTFTDTRKRELFTNKAGSVDYAPSCTHAGGIDMTECATTKVTTTIKRVR